MHYLNFTKYCAEVQSKHFLELSRIIRNYVKLLQISLLTKSGQSTTQLKPVDNWWNVQHDCLNVRWHICQIEFQTKPWTNLLRIILLQAGFARNNAIASYSRRTFIACTSPEETSLDWILFQILLVIHQALLYIVLTTSFSWSIL